MAATPNSNHVVEGAGGVVFNSRGEVLLIRHKNGTWVFPKGHLDPGEDHLKAAVREVEEEAGVHAHCPDSNRHWITSYTNPRGQRRRITWFHLFAEDERPIMREQIFPEGRFGGQRRRRFSASVRTAPSWVASSRREHPHDLR